jgi:HTH-type transcriptional regulator / antitoxin HigA
MAIDASLTFSPDYAVAPGETLLETLEALKMTQAELATRIERPLKTINEIVKGKSAITPETALQLEQALGVPAAVWSGLESNYQLVLATAREKERLRSFVDWLKTLPTKQLQTKRIITETTDEIELIRSWLKFFGVTTPQALRHTSTLVAFHRTQAFEPNQSSLMAWLRLGELEGRDIECRPFDRFRFKQTIEDLRKLTLETRADRIRDEIFERCRTVGVAVAFVSELQGTRVCGAARWLAPDKALIQLSCRYKVDDQFWFAFFHEAGHILLHGKKEGFLDVKLEGTAQHEVEASHFAANVLIPDSQIQALSNLKPLTKDLIVQFAADVGVSPGIVVGQLQHRRRLVYQTPLNRLKKGIDLCDTESLKSK